MNSLLIKLRFALKAVFLITIFSVITVGIYPTPQALALDCLEGGSFSIRVDNGFLSAVSGSFGYTNSAATPICDITDAQISSYFDSYEKNRGYYFDQAGPGTVQETLPGSRTHNATSPIINLSKEFTITPIGYWQFDQTSGTPLPAYVYNSIKYGTDGSVYGTTTSFWSAGKYKNSGAFNGSDNYISWDLNDIYDLNTLSVSFWFRSSNPPNNSWSNNPYLISRSADGGLNDWAIIGKPDGKIYIIIGVDDTGIAGTTVIPSSKTLNDGYWHHIVWTRDGPSQMNALYIDGVIDIPSTPDTNATIVTTTTPTKVGGRGSNYFKGNIDEMAIYNTALFPEDVSKIYYRGVVTQNPKVYRVKKVSDLIGEEGNLIIEDNITSEIPGVIFVDGNLSINSNLTGSPNDTGLVFVVKGDTYIARSVSQVDAFIISYGDFCDYYNTTSLTCDFAGNSSLVINGSVVSLSKDPLHNPKFNRSLANNRYTPAEVINFQPKYLVIIKTVFGRDANYWAEVQ